MLKFTDEQLIAMSKKGLIHLLSGATDTDHPMGTVTIEDLPELFLRFLIRQHNAKVDHVMSHIPSHRHQFRYKIEKLQIPTYGDFQRILDDNDWKKRVDPELRKARDFSSYRRWVLRQEPLSTWFRPLMAKPFSFTIPAKFRARHTFLLGSSGSGKSEAIKVCIINSKQHLNVDAPPTTKRDMSIVLIDPHGDLAEDFARERMYHGDFRERVNQGKTDYDLIYIDPLLKANENIFPVLNPFDVASKRYSRFQLEKIAQQLVSAITSILGNDTGLSLNMSTLLHPCVVVLLSFQGKTMLDLMRFMNDDPELIALGQQSTNTAHRMFFRERFKNTAFKRTKEAIATKIQSLTNNEVFTKVVCGSRSTIDLESAVNSGASIIVNCAKGKLGNEVSSSFGKLIVAMLLAIAFNRAEQRGPRIPISLFVDECQNFISPAIQTALTEARKYRLDVTLAQQVIGQGMDPELTKIILGNTAVKAIGNAGNFSLNTMAKEMGAPPEVFQNLSVGTFVTKCGDHPPVRMRMDSSHVGGKTCMSTSEWAELISAISGKYYRKENVSGEHHHETKDQQLTEEITAGDVTPTTAEDTTEKPLFDVDHFEL